MRVTVHLFLSFHGVMPAVCVQSTDRRDPYNQRSTALHRWFSHSCPLSCLLARAASPGQVFLVLLIEIVERLALFANDGEKFPCDLRQIAS